MPDTFTIVFRGLMIFHEDERNQLMEIGMLREETHVPRILTIKNGVTAALQDLRSRPELSDPTHRIWRLDVTKPAKEGIRIYTNGSGDLDRKTHGDDRDFRWIMDFEGKDFYDRDLTEQMISKKLMPILQIRQGEFYTRLKSPPLKRKEDDGAFKLFGAVAGVTGLDIPINGGSVTLTVAGSETRIFSFVKEGESIPANTIFEFANTPPEVFLDPHGGHGNGGHGGQVHRDHFQFYYNLFPPNNLPSPKFTFEPLDLAPGPDPALCGKGRVGLRKPPL